MNSNGVSHSERSRFFFLKFLVHILHDCLSIHNTHLALIFKFLVIPVSSERSASFLAARATSRSPNGFRTTKHRALFSFSKLAAACNADNPTSPLRKILQS